MIYNICKGLLVLLGSHIIFTYYEVNKQTINKVYLIPETYNTIAPIIQEKINEYIYNIKDDGTYSKEDLNDITTKKQAEIVSKFVEYIRKDIVMHAKNGFYRYYWSDKTAMISKSMLAEIVNKLKEQFPNISFKEEFSFTNVNILVDWT